jgi:CRP-like cAMP-binding protein
MNSPAAEHDGSGPCEFSENLEILRQTDFFSGFPIEKLKVLAYLCTREEFPSGDLLFATDEDDGRGFFVISGQLTLLFDAGGEALEVRRFGPGQFLGGLSLLGSMRRLFSLRSDTASVCLVIEREKFTKALEQFPELVPRLLQAVSRRVHAWEKRLLFDMVEEQVALAGRAGVSVL